MRVTILAIFAAILVSTWTAYFVLVPASSLQAAVGASVNTQQNSIIFDASRIVELLKALIAARSTQTGPAVTIPYATTTPAAPAVKPQATSTPAKKPVVTAPVTPSVQEPPTQRALELALPNLRSALVNIVCLPVNPGTLHGVSGSGIIIDPHGIILTVAHVAQYEILAQARPDLMKCFVRTGSPASLAYRAQPIYISTSWISQNAQTISSASPQGTGENDYALLAITSSDTSTPLPSAFPYVPLATTPPNVNEQVVIGSYGAEFLTSTRIRSDLFPTLVFGSVHDRFTFHADTVDVISLGGGAAAQQGSSGGGIENSSGQLIGLITTSSSGASLASRDLHAVTSTYLQRAFKQESGFDLNSYIASASPMILANAYVVQEGRLASTLTKANGL